MLPATDGCSHELTKASSIRVPAGGLAAVVAEVAEQGGAGGKEAEDGVFHDRLAGPTGVDPSLHVLVVVTVATGSNLFSLAL